jgi:hypothetical protein
MNYEQDAANPLDSPVMRKTFRVRKAKQREIVPKEVIDEVVFMAEPLANRLRSYIQGEGPKEDDQVKICYGTARTMINKLGEGVLRDQNLKTPQVYLDKLSDSEAIRWMDVLYGK